MTGEVIGELEQLEREIRSLNGPLEEITKVLVRVGAIDATKLRNSLIRAGVVPATANRQSAEAAALKDSADRSLDRLVEAVDGVKYHVDIALYETRAAQALRKA